MISKEALIENISCCFICKKEFDSIDNNTFCYTVRKSKIVCPEKSENFALEDLKLVTYKDDNSCHLCEIIFCEKCFSDVAGKEFLMENIDD